MTRPTILVLADDASYQAAKVIDSAELVRAADFVDFKAKLQSVSSTESICCLELVENFPAWFQSLSEETKDRVCFFGKVNPSIPQELPVFPDIRGALEFVVDGNRIESVASQGLGKNSLKVVMNARITGAMYGDNQGLWDKDRFNAHLNSISINMEDPVDSVSNPAVPSNAYSPASSLDVASCVLAATLTKFLIENSNQNSNLTPHPLPIPNSPDKITLSWEKAFPLIFGLVDFLDDDANLTMASDDLHVSLCATGKLNFGRALRGYTDSDVSIEEYRTTVRKYFSNAISDQWMFTEKDGIAKLSFKKAQ